MPTVVVETIAEAAIIIWQLALGIHVFLKLV